MFDLSKSATWSGSAMSEDARTKAISGIADSSLLMLADILPTGVFAAVQALNHPKVLPIITGKPWPLCFSASAAAKDNEVSFTAEDRIFTLAIIGLGPVGVCASVSMLDALSTRELPFRIIAIDPLESRREKMKAVYNAIDKEGKGSGEFSVQSIDDAREAVQTWTGGIGCTAVLEVCLGLCRGNHF